MVTRPMRTSTITTIGTSNVMPNTRNMVSANDRYCSMSGATVIDLGAQRYTTSNTAPKTMK